MVDIYCDEHFVTTVIGDGKLFSRCPGKSDFIDFTDFIDFIDFINFIDFVFKITCHCVLVIAEGNTVHSDSDN